MAILNLELVVRLLGRGVHGPLEGVQLTVQHVVEVVGDVYLCVELLRLLHLRFLVLKLRICQIKGSCGTSSKDIFNGATSDSIHGDGKNFHRK